MKAATKSSRGNKYAHLMCSANGLYFVHPMPVKSDASTALEKFFRKFGIMTDLHTDNAPELTAGDDGKTANNHTVNCTSTEPHSLWQNRADPGINMVKKHARRAINQERIPGEAWDYVLSLSAEVLSHLAFTVNGNRMGIENVLGDSPDISHRLYFDIYQPIHYLEQVVAFPQDRQLLVRWLGPLHDVGQALYFWTTMKPTGKVISQSKVKAITKSDIALNVCGWRPTLLLWTNRMLSNLVRLRRLSSKRTNRMSVITMTAKGTTGKLTTRLICWPRTYLSVRM